MKTLFEKMRDNRTKASQIKASKDLARKKRQEALAREQRALGTQYPSTNPSYAYGGFNRNETGSSTHPWIG